MENYPEEQEFRWSIKAIQTTALLRSARIRGAFNKFPDFFVQAFEIVVDSWKITMLLLYIL